MRQNPFSLYDFMGYFIPGAATIYLFQVVELLKDTETFVLFDFVNQFPKVNSEGVFVFIIIAYSIGHIISFLSSILIEKYANWKYGYPSKYLLDIPSNSYFKKKDERIVKFWKFITCLGVLPLALLDLVIGQCLGFKQYYSKKLDIFLVELITSKIERLIDVINLSKANYSFAKVSNSDFHRIVTHYAYEYSANHQSKLRNYVALYGFLRTFTLIFIGLFWYFIIHSFYVSSFDIQFIVISLTLAIISYIFFMAFMKFYRRYTLEGFMILVIDKEIT